MNNFEGIIINLNRIKGEVRKELENGKCNQEIECIQLKERQMFDLQDSISILSELNEINSYEYFRLNMNKDPDILLGWHSNISSWIMDNLGIVSYDVRNELAQKFIKRFFNIDYDWVKLVNPNNRTYSAGEVFKK
jgi:hypothetical protein